MHVDGDDNVLSLLEDALRSRSALDAADVRRRRTDIKPGHMGGGEVLTFFLTDVSLPLLLNAVYDFFKARRRSRPAERVCVTVTRTDHPNGARSIELRLDGPAEVALDAVRDAFSEFGKRD